MKSILPAVLLASPFSGMSLGVAAQDAQQRNNIGVEIFVNNHRSGESNGCTTALASKGTITCGHPDHVSKVEWSFLRSTPRGEIYSVTRKYPLGKAALKTETKEISYQGTAVILWQDEHQKIIFRPRPKHH